MKSHFVYDSADVAHYISEKREHQILIIRYVKKAIEIITVETP